MLNYEHESKKILDRYLKNYIFYDYFHDSVITKVIYEDKTKTVRIDLSCEREWPKNKTFDLIDDQNYAYSLFFKDCRYFEYMRESDDTFCEYLNGRFKKSAKLHELSRDNRKTYYHLRIQLADGYIDIIFNKFHINKAIGIVELPSRISLEWHFDYVRNKYSSLDIEEIRRLARQGDWIERINAMEYLLLISDDACCELALDGINDEDMNIVSIYILGEIGKFNDIATLNLFIKQDKYSAKWNRHISDAIEKILYRSRNAQKVGQNDFV